MVKGSNDQDGNQANPIRVLAKAGLLLDALDEQGELTPSELADILGEPRSSVYRLLASLEGLGFVAPGVKTGTLRLGMKLYKLGNSAVRDRDIRTAALPHMVELREKTESTVFLAIRSGYEVLCIERIEGRWTVSNALLPGTTAPMHVGAVGKVLLAAEPPAFWDAYCENVELVSFTKYSITSRDALVPVLDKVRQSGVAISDEDRLLGMAGVGAPIRDHSGATTGAIAFSAPRPMVLADHQEESVHLIRDVANAISRSLGYEPSPAPT